MYGAIKELDLCVNEKERRIVKRVDKLTEKDWLFWQDIDEQIPLLIIVFIGSSIFKQHWILKGLIVAYVTYGYRIKSDVAYFFDVIYKRLKGKYDE